MNKTKKLHFTVLSEQVCRIPGCRTKIKQRLIEQRQPQNIKYCYKHYKELQQAHKLNSPFGRGNKGIAR